MDCMEGRIGNYGEAVKHGHKGAFVIISDVRFDNEAEMIKRNGGTVIGVNSDRDTIPHHESEAGVSACMIDGYIDNIDDMDTLRKRVLVYMESLLECSLDDAFTIVLPDEEEGQEDETD